MIRCSDLPRFLLLIVFVLFARVGSAQLLPYAPGHPCIASGATTFYDNATGKKLSCRTGVEASAADSPAYQEWRGCTDKHPDDISKCDSLRPGVVGASPSARQTVVVKTGAQAGAGAEAKGEGGKGGNAKQGGQRQGQEQGQQQTTRFKYEVINNGLFSGSASGRTKAFFTWVDLALAFGVMMPTGDYEGLDARQLAVGVMPGIRISLNFLRFGAVAGISRAPGEPPVGGRPPHTVLSLYTQISYLKGLTVGVKQYAPSTGVLTEAKGGNTADQGVFDFGLAVRSALIPIPVELRLAYTLIKRGNSTLGENADLYAVPDSLLNGFTVGGGVNPFGPVWIDIDYKVGSSAERYYSTSGDLSLFTKDMKLLEGEQAKKKQYLYVGIRMEF